MRRLASYVKKYDPLLGPGAGERLYRTLQREAALASAAARMLAPRRTRSCGAAPLKYGRSMVTTRVTTLGRSRQTERHACHRKDCFIN